MTHDIESRSGESIGAPGRRRPARAREPFPATDRAELVLDALADAILAVDRLGRVSYLNRAAEGLTGWTRTDAEGHPVDDLLRLLDRVTGARVTLGPKSAACLVAHSDGSQTEVEASSVPGHDRKGRVAGAVVVLQATGSALEAARRLFKRAHYDGLTGLPNRLLLQDRLREAVALARRTRRPLAVLFLDVDRFKQINDTWGHPAGDQVLRSVAGRITGILRESDTLSRYGGDEFVALLPEIARPEDANRVAHKLCRALVPPHVVGSSALTVTVSVGIAIGPTHGRDADTLIAAADSAMYAAKAEARGRYRVFDVDQPGRDSAPDSQPSPRLERRRSGADASRSVAGR